MTLTVGDPTAPAEARHREAAPPAVRRVRRVYSETAAQVQNRLVDQLRAQLDGLSADGARAAMQHARVWRHIALRELDEYVTAHPGALLAPDPHCPWGLVRLGYALAAAGHPVTLLACVSCGRSTPELRRRTAKGRSCDWCASRTKLRRCARCGQDGHPVASRGEGVICRRCYRIDPDFLQTCAGCGRHRPPTRRDPDGQAWCWSCATRPAKTCAGCGEHGPVHAAGPSGPVCSRCYRRAPLQCARCGRLRPIAAAALELCAACAPQPHHACGSCGRSRPAPAIWPMGPVCRSCYRRIRANPQPCTGCGQTRALIGRSPDGQGLCGPCAGTELDYTCRTCHEPNQLYAEGRCARCVLLDRVGELLTGPSGRSGGRDGAGEAVGAFLRPVADTLAAAGRAESVLRWLQRGRGASLLVQLAALDRPVTHADLDELPQPDRLDLLYLRRLLVHAGVLPGRVEALERLDPWLDRLLAGRPATHGSVIRPFAQWAVLRTARRSAARSNYTSSAAARDRAEIRAATHLLADLDQQGLTLTGLTQTHLDRRLAGHPPGAEHLRCFLTWTAARGLTGPLLVAVQRHGPPTHFLDEDEHLAQLRHCLHDPIPLTVRVAGSLVLLFGQPLTRIARLTAGAISHRGDQVLLTVADHPVLLPPALAHLVQQLADQPQLVSALPPSPGASRWLFPGRPAGQPLTASTLGRWLNEHGIHARPARNTALLQLAGDLPAAVLAELLGLHINTAVGWSGYARRDWAAYLNTAGPNTPMARSET